MVAAVSIGGIAALVLAIFWAVLVLFLALVLVNVFRLLESMKMMIDGMRTETVPMLAEVTVSVKNVNREFERVDTLLASAGNITKSVERLSSVVENTVSSPLIKVAAFSAGAARAVRRFRGEK